MNRGNRRLGELDVAKRFFPHAPVLLVQAGFGVFCALAVYGVRQAIDVVAPSSSPFSLLYPAVLVSTLFGRWQSGLITLVLSFFYSWYYILPYHASFAFQNPEDAPRTAINFFALSFCFVLVELFRRAVQRAAEERTREVAARDLLLREIDHRMKNNFAIVASLLELQKRQEKSADAQAALGVAAARVQSFASAHQAIYNNGDDLNSIEMNAYLQVLADYLVSALFLKDKVKLELDADVMRMPRDQAVAIGIVLNEVVTNAAKHAFTEAEMGCIHIEFRADGDQWRLHVTDDGKGMPASANSRGLGTTLIASFAEKARAIIVNERLTPGTRVTLSGVKAA